MKYIILPIFRFLYFLLIIVSVFILFLWSILMCIWEFNTNPIKHFYYELTQDFQEIEDDWGRSTGYKYKNPIHYLINKKTPI